jgi:hypothetical protein
VYRALLGSAALPQTARRPLVAVSPNHPELARYRVVEDHRAGGVPVLERQWYYTIEIEPGVWTRGQEFANVALTRHALRNVAVEGSRCVDLGSMDGLVAVLLARRGAASILAYDRLSFPEKVALLKERLGIEFEYRCGLSFAAFRQGYDGPLADVLIFSGVLYHMIDPLGGLLRARSLVRNGGILIVETGAAMTDRLAAEFNAYARLYDGDNFFLPSVLLLDYWLRFARLEPLDCFYFQQQPRREGEPRLCRICVPCRAVSQAPAEPDDGWIRRRFDIDFAEYGDFAACEREGGPPVQYAGRELLRRLDGSLDLPGCVAKLAPAPTPPELRRLALGDVV